MQAVLYVAHGSRMQEAVLQTKEFLRNSMVKIDVPIQEHSFLELARPTMEEGVIRCVERGATSIAVVPLLLLAAGHAKQDIPQEIRRMQNQFPDITFSYGRPFGVHEAIVDIAVERMRETKQKIAADARILLIGRGSSDADTPRYFREIAKLLNNKSKLSPIRTCFLAACEPSFETALETEIRAGASQIFVIPYLLFTGFLMKTIENRIRELNLRNQSMILCSPLGPHDNLIQILSERVQEAVTYPQKKLKKVELA